MDFLLDGGNENISRFAENQVVRESGISATKLARKILNQALMNDSFEIRDDASCGVIYFRQPCEFMHITGPLFYKIKDSDFMLRIQEFPKKNNLWWYRCRNYRPGNEFGN